MSFVTSLKNGFKNFGHAIAVAAKGVSVGIKDVALVANKAQVLEPEVDLLVAALAGPLGVKVSDTAFHLLGDVAEALTKTGAAATDVAGSTGLNLTLDAALVETIKELIPVLEGIAKTGGATVPAAK